jgi:hypothetical protein
VIGAQRLNRLIPAVIPLVVVALSVLLLGACGAPADGKAGQAERWDIEGPLLAWDDALWIVDRTAIVVPAALGMDDQRTLGALVRASGRYDERGRRITTAITIEQGSSPESTLPPAAASGTIAAIDGDVWTLGETRVIVASGTELRAADPNADLTALAKVGMLADVRGFASDVGLIAIQVVLSAPIANPAPALTQPEPQNTPTVTVADDPSPDDEAPASDEGQDGDDGDDASDEETDSDDDDANDQKKHEKHDGDHGKKKKKSHSNQPLLGMMMAGTFEWSGRV